MSNRPNPNKNRPAPNRSVAAARGSNGPSRLVWIIGAVVIVVAGALLAAVLANTSSKKSVPKGTDAQSIVNKAATVPASVTDQVGVGSVDGSSLKAVKGPALTKDAKPEILFVGAEYCPYCAAERWGVINALARFGTFSNVGLTRSSSADVFPQTPTLTFHGSRYTSPYVVFTAVEVAGSAQDKPLDPLTPQQQQLQEANGGGSIPFLDLGGNYVSSGATYSPEVLQGKSYDEIVAAMRDPGSDVAKGAVGTGNVFTAIICQTTGGKPANVCDTAGVRAAQSVIPAS